MALALAEVEPLSIYNSYFTSLRRPQAAGSDAKRCRSSGSLKEGGGFGGGVGRAEDGMGSLPTLSPAPVSQGGTEVGSKTLFKDSSSSLQTKALSWSQAEP